MKLSDKVKSRILISLSGILLGITVIFAKLGALAYLAMIPLALVLYKKLCSGSYRARSAYLDGFIFYMSFDLVIFHWFTYFYPLEFAGFTPPDAILIIALAWIGLSMLQSVFSAFVFVLISLFSKTEISKKHPILLAPVAAALVAVNEWTQTFTWAGVPWGRIAISQTEMPVMMQSASLFGSYFITFVIVLFNFLAAYAIFNADRRRIAAFSALALLVANIACGTVLYFVSTADESRSIKVAAVQGNLESQSNYDLSMSEIYAIYEKQSRDAVENGAELIIWSEGVLSADITSVIKVEGKGYDSIKGHVSALAGELGATVIIGTFVEENDIVRNSLSAFYQNGESVIGAYSKVKLVPFGEYVPMREFITAIVPQLGQINMLSSDITPGEEFSVFGATSDADAIKIGSLICFDSIYEVTALGAARSGAEILIVPSNDSWFYDSRALNMHHSQNILRAVEQGKYTVSCGNTGITSIVTDKGRVISEIPIYTEGYVLDTVYASSGRTLYSYIGNVFVYLCIAFVVAVFVTEPFIKIKNR